MSDQQASHSIPTAVISLEVEPSLARILGVGDSYKQARRSLTEGLAEQLTHARESQTLQDSLTKGLADLTQTLGIPGDVVVNVTPFRGSSLRAGHLLHLSVNGQLLYYPDELPVTVQNYLSDSPSEAGSAPSAVLEWLIRGSRNGSGLIGTLARQMVDMLLGNQDIRIVQFLTLASLEIVKGQTGVLLGTEQFNAYVDALPAEVQPTSSQERMALHSILQAVLNLGISLADKRSVEDALRQTQLGRDTFEKLIDRLHSAAVEIHVHSAYLQSLTRQGQQGLFTSLRDKLYKESGINYPDFGFVQDQALEPDRFAFKINSLMTLPMSQKDIAARDLSSADPLEDLAFALGEALRKNAACFVSRRHVQESLDKLKYAFPELVDLALSRHSIGQLTQVLRALVSEAISIRDLRLILERMLDADYRFDDSSQYVILDDRPTDSSGQDVAEHDDEDSLVSFVRAGMKRQISYKYSGGAGQLRAYSLGDEIEKLMLPHATHTDKAVRPELDEKYRDRILDAIRAQVGFSPTDPSPVILTSSTVRPYLRRAIVSELPQVPVVAYQELVPDLKIEEVGRISLNSGS
jgi:hypothetical protein